MIRDIGSSDTTWIVLGHLKDESKKILHPLLGDENETQEK